MVRRVLATLLVVATLSGSASLEVLAPPSSTAVADGTGLPKCC